MIKQLSRSSRVFYPTAEPRTRFKHFVDLWFLKDFLTIVSEKMTEVVKMVFDKHDNDVPQDLWQKA